MRIVGLLIVLAFGTSCARVTAGPVSRIDLPLEQRLEVPQKVAATSLKLTDMTGFIGTSYKVPILVETPTPIPDLKIPEGSYTARQLLDLTVNQLPGFEWKDESGVAHLYEKTLVGSAGNLLNVRIRRFAFQHDVGEFMYFFRPCIFFVIEGSDCMSGGAYAGFRIPKLQKGQLPYLQSFSNVPARDILLSALKANGRFYVLVAFEGTKPELKSQFPFVNWFAYSSERSEPEPMWIDHQKLKHL
jgi:hypothetical protein